MRRTPLALRFPWLAALLVACGDDGSAGPQDGSSGDSSGTESASGPSTDTLTTADTSAGTTIDSASAEGSDTSASTTATESSSGGSTGPLNAAPVAADDVVYTVQDEALAVDAVQGVLANDVDDDGDALTVSDADALSQYGGTVMVDADGAIAYAPAPGFWGPDTFEYTVTDGIDEATGTVTIHVAPRLVPLGDVAMGISGFILNGELIGDRAGHAVSHAGDVDGDGLDDVIVGANRADPNGSDSGRAYVVFGKADTEPVQLAEIVAGNGGFALHGEAMDDNAGTSVSRAGDVDGDGLDDVIVGAQYADANGGDSGRAYVVFGKADGAGVDLEDVVAGIGGFSLEGESAGDRAGFSVSGVGDVNGDDLDDVVVGAFFAGPSGDASGRAYVVFGKADTDTVDLGAIALGDGGFAIDGEAAYDNAGISVSGAGDIDGDGIGDLVIGAPYADINGGDAGRGYVVFGKADTDPVLLVDVAAGVGGFAIDGATASDYAGFPVSGAGDIDGDGLADVLVGAFRADTAAIESGRAYVVFGKADGDPVLLADVGLGVGGFPIDGVATQDEAGRSMAGVGDLDGDGLDDLVVGAPGADPMGGESGRCYVVLGKADTDPVLLGAVGADAGGFAIDGELAADAAGVAVDGAGDVNGDGVLDLIIGAERADPNGESSGRGYVVFGVPLAPR